MRISQEEKVLRRKNAERTVNRMRLWRQALAGKFDDLTDEEFAAKLNIIPSNRKAFIEWLRDNPSETEESIEEIIALYIVDELSDKAFLEKLSTIEFINSYFEDADDPYPEDYRLGTLDILRGENWGFHTFDPALWEKILKIAQSKNILVTPTDYQIGSSLLSKKVAV